METQTCFYYRNFINELCSQRTPGELIISEEMMTLMTWTELHMHAGPLFAKGWPGNGCGSSYLLTVSVAWDRALDTLYCVPAGVFEGCDFPTKCTEVNCKEICHMLQPHHPLHHTDLLGNLKHVLKAPYSFLSSFLDLLYHNTFHLKTG